MNWKQKFEICRKLLETDDDLWTDFSLKPPASEAEVSGASEYWSPDYIDFLRQANGAEIAQCTFCGTTQKTQAEEMYGDLQDPGAFRPFGWDAGGTPFFFDSQGGVAIGLSKISRKTPRKVASSFSSFLSDVIMGMEYPVLYQEEPEDDPWFDFVCKQGWASNAKEPSTESPDDGQPAQNGGQKPWWKFW